MFERQFGPSICLADSVLDSLSRPFLLHQFLIAVGQTSRPGFVFLHGSAQGTLVEGTAQLASFMDDPLGFRLLTPSPRI